MILFHDEGGESDKAMAWLGHKRSRLASFAATCCPAAGSLRTFSTAVMMARGHANPFLRRREVGCSFYRVLAGTVVVLTLVQH